MMTMMKMVMMTIITCSSTCADGTWKLPVYNNANNADNIDYDDDEDDDEDEDDDDDDVDDNLQLDVR